MRILHVLPPAAGGMLRHLQALREGLPPDRYAHFCLAAPDAGLEILAQCQPECCLTLPLRNGAGFPALLRAAWAAARTARAQHPDLLHGHGYRGMLLAALASRITRYPFVFTAHNLPGELGPRFWKMAARLCAHGAGAVCVSQAVADGLAQRLPSGFPLTVVYNGIELGPRRERRINLPSALAPATRRPVVVTAARLARQKGVDVLLEAWAQIAADFPEGIVLIAGDGPERPALEARAETLGIRKSILFAGFRDDVRALLRAADAAAIPSLMEGQSVFAVEAMAEGAPIVASRVGGLPEMVREGETGLLAAPGDANALAAALRRVLSDPDLARRLATAARARAESQWTTAHMLAGMDAFYQQCARREG